MKRFLYILGIVLALSIVATSCEKAPFLTLSTPKTINFTDQGGTQSITFTANRDWSVSSSDSWCKVSPSSGNKADGNISVTLTCESNTTYDPRSATLTVRVEELSETITVTQDTNLGLLVSPTSYDLTNAAQSIEVEVRANVKYSVEIDAACKDWITQTGTKALSTEKTTFSIAANESYDNREGKITIKQTDGTLAETVKIKQAQTDGLIVGKKDYEVGRDGETIEILLQTNVEYDVIIPEDAKDWVTRVESAPTKALVNESVYLQIAENPTYYNREVSVVIKKKNADLQETVLIKQAQTDALFVSDERKEYKVPSKGGEIIVNVFHNIDFEVDATSIPEWITISKTDVDTYNSKLSFKVNQNTEYVGRDDEVKIVGGTLSDVATISQHQVDIVSTNISEFAASWHETDLTVIIQRNVDCTPSLPAWIVEKSKKSEKEGYLTVDTIVYTIAENLDEERKGTIGYSWLNEGVDSVTSLFVKQECCTISIDSPGSLIDNLSSEQLSRIRVIKLIGKIDGTDIVVIRRMPNLYSLDISNASIVSGGRQYYQSYETQNNVVGNYMFFDLPNLKRVHLPNNIIRIGDWAFNSTALDYINLPDGIEYIGTGALYGSHFSSLILPSHLKIIGTQAFCQIKVDTNEATLPEGLEEIGFLAFEGVQTFHIKAYPTTLKSIGVFALGQGYSTVKVYVPKGTKNEYFFTELGNYTNLFEE